MTWKTHPPMAGCKLSEAGLFSQRKKTLGGRRRGNSSLQAHEGGTEKGNNLFSVSTGHQTRGNGFMSCKENS